jgi:small subunit ribosomal protein S7
MPRRREVPKRKILPESKYGDETLAKFMNNLMLRGKKSVAERIVYDALDLLKAKSNEEDALAVFKKAIENVKPMVEVKSRRVGGSTYQVPVEIRGSRRTALGMRWIINFSRNRGERTMAEKLAAELYDASQGRGNSVKKREDTHRMAEANKAFAHYRW